MNDRVVIIGGGVAGLSAAQTLADMGIPVTLLEKENQVGGHVRNWDRLFPTRRKSDEVIGFLDILGKKNIDVHLRVKIESIHKNGEFIVKLSDNKEVRGSAVLLATGYELFDAFRKEEYGYNIYDHVITAADLEAILKTGNKPLVDGNPPKRIAFVHCVGSRDEKAGNLYCSKVCCVTGVKQAIELKEMFPAAEIFNFYMDLRMFDRHFEEMYFEAQRDYGINFIRGRVSECSENADNSVVVKLEDTLTGRPLKITVDLLILLTGMVPSQETRNIAEMLGLELGEDRFVLPADEHTGSNHSKQDGVFLAGAIKGPACVTSSIADGRAAAVQIASYLKKVKT